MYSYCNKEKDLIIASRKNSKFAISREIYKSEIQSKLNNLFYLINIFYSN